MITSILRQEIIDQKINHAYLFSGMQGVGKTSTARILAQTINCVKPLASGERCQNCKICKRSLDELVDIHEIDGASNSGVEQIRNLQDDVIIAPVLGHYKVYIIDEVHMLSRSAFNAFLKILEEPPQHVVFVLATTELEKLPATILSRCQHFGFVGLQPEVLLKLLTKVSQQEKLNIATEALQIMAQTTNGAAREALNLLEQLAASFRSATTIDKATMEKFLGHFQTTAIQSFLEAILENQTTIIWQTVQKWSNQNINFFKLTENIVAHCNQLQRQAYQNWIAFTASYPYFNHWKLEETNLLQKISNVCLQNLPSFQLSITPRFIFEFIVLQLLQLQPPLSFNQQRHYLQILKRKNESLQKKVKEVWTNVLDKIKPSDDSLEGLLANTKPFFSSNGTIVLVAETSTIHKLQKYIDNKDNKDFWFFWKDNGFPLDNYEVKFFTPAMRQLLKEKYDLAKISSQEERER